MFEGVVELKLTLEGFDIGYQWHDVRVDIIPVPSKLDVVTDKLRITDRKIEVLSHSPHV